MQVTKAGDYLAERLATIATLVDKSMPAVAALFDTIPMRQGRKAEMARQDHLV